MPLNSDQPDPPPESHFVVILGDLHGHWGPQDEEYYSDLPSELLLWTGDLADSTSRQMEIANSLSRCGRKAVGLLGNHDGASHLLASCEAHGYRFWEWCLSFGHARHVQRLRAALGEHDIGFARRELPQLGLTVIGMCPLQSGGARVAFAKTLRHVYGVTDPEPVLRQLVEESESNRLLLLGHNGPAGFGSEPLAPFGCDWKEDGGDHGDLIFARVLEYAAESGKEVALAVAGHMHDRCDGRIRDAVRCVRGVPALNVCRVPRLENHSGEIWHWDYRAEFSPSVGLLRIERVAWVGGKGIMRRQRVYPAT